MKIKVTTSLKQILLAVYLTFSFRGILNTPIEGIGYAVELVLSLGAVFFFFIYFMDSIIKRKLKTIHWLGVLLCSLPFISAISAKLEFGQPFIYGILSQRDYFLILTPYLILYLLDIEVLSLSLLEKTFVRLSWFFLIAFTLVVLFIDPAPYIKTGIVGYKEIKGGYIFRFQMVFILFGAIYYALKGIDQKRWIFYAYALLFISYVILVRQDRTIVLFLLMTLTILLLKRLSFKKIFNFLIITSVLLIGLISFGTLIGHESINQLNNLYYQTFLTIFGDPVPGQKVDVRWSELDTAITYIKKNPIWGSGELSKRWNGGFERFDHFYPSDIGVFGVVFIYGIAGFLIACSQMVYFYFLNKKFQLKNTVFASSLKYSILLFYLNSFSDGSLMQRTAIGMTMVTLYYHYTQTKKSIAIEST